MGYRSTSPHERPAMHTLEFTDDELRIVHFALETWINSFSHDQPELLHAGKLLRAKVDGAMVTAGPNRENSPVAS